MGVAYSDPGDKRMAEPLRRKYYFLLLLILLSMDLIRRICCLYGSFSVLYLGSGSIWLTLARSLGGNGGNEGRLSMFCYLVLLKDYPDFHLLQQGITTFMKASNALLNFHKTERFSFSGSSLPH
ncbi:hypothetical protein BDB01DRAFT_570748 [Pilobolus umbonatus]|nr:hypothetical protein BDB01DRAFT_570748 [Pilobolus umbonatus]